jgi:hypothetical protein
MTGLSVQIEAHRVVKSYPSEAAAGHAITRAAQLSAAQIMTPVPVAPTPTTLAFPRLHGRSGIDLLGDLQTLLAPLQTLHRTPIPNLPSHDPFRRITPRIPLAPPSLQTRIAILAALPRPQPTATIHGDFHPGQVIADADGTAWLIDLDDMALATPEADLGNLLAWLLTAPAVQEQRPATGWKSALLNAWNGAHLHPATLCIETEIALIRRGLKRAGAGDFAPLHHLLSGGYSDALSDG